MAHMRLIIPLNLIQIYSLATGFTIPDYESVRGPLECLDMKRVEGKFVYEETQQKTAPVDYPKNVGIVGDYNEYYDEQQCAIFLMTDMSNIIDLRITLHNDNCAVCDVDYEGDFVCDEVKVSWASWIRRNLAKHVKKATKGAGSGRFQGFYSPGVVFRDFLEVFLETFQGFLALFGLFLSFF